MTGGAEDDRDDWEVPTTTGMTGRCRRQQGMTGGGYMCHGAVHSAFRGLPTPHSGPGRALPVPRWPVTCSQILTAASLLKTSLLKIGVTVSMRSANGDTPSSAEPRLDGPPSSLPCSRPKLIHRRLPVGATHSDTSTDPLTQLTSVQVHVHTLYACDFGIYLRWNNSPQCTRTFFIVTRLSLCRARDL